MKDMLKKYVYLPHTVFTQVQVVSRYVNVLINTQIQVLVMGRVEVCNNTSRYSQASQYCNTEYHKSFVNLFGRHLESGFSWSNSLVYVFSGETSPQKFPSSYDASHSHCAKLLKRHFHWHDIISSHVLIKKSLVHSFILIFDSSSCSLSHLLSVPCFFYHFWRYTSQFSFLFSPKRFLYLKAALTGHC